MGVLPTSFKELIVQDVLEIIVAKFIKFSMEFTKDLDAEDDVKSVHFFGNWSMKHIRVSDRANEDDLAEKT